MAIVIRLPTTAGPIECCPDSTMVIGKPLPCGASITPGPRTSSGPVIGRRYEDVLSELEVLCIRTGDGTLTYLGRSLQVVASGIRSRRPAASRLEGIELARS